MHCTRCFHSEIFLYLKHIYTKFMKTMLFLWNGPKFQWSSSDFFYYLAPLLENICLLVNINLYLHSCKTRIILYVRPANKRHHIVTSSLIGWAHAQNNPWDIAKVRSPWGVMLKKYHCQNINDGFAAVQPPRGGLWNFRAVTKIYISKASKIPWSLAVRHLIPDSKVHGANMEPTWVLLAPDGPHVGPMNLAIRDHLINNPHRKSLWTYLN